MRIETAHIEHGVLDKSIRHVKAALKHVVVASCDIERINFVSCRDRSVKAAE